MNKAYIFISLALFLGIAISYHGSWVAGYDGMSATAKQGYLWDQIVKDGNASNEWPGAWALIKLIAPEFLGGYKLAVTGNRNSDQFPDGREKAIHSVGFIAKMKFNWTAAANKYTGGFKKADIGYVRLSSAKSPSDGETAPGISVKLLRDGITSANFLAMYGIGGQKSNNFFKNVFANHITSANLDIPTKILLKRFEGADPNPGMVGFADMAQFNEDGSEESNPNAPFILVFQPNPELTNKCEGVALDGVYFGCVQSLPAGTELWKVYATQDPILAKDLPNRTADIELLGTMTTTSEFRKSAFADKQMFYKHVYWNDEMKRVGRPQWANAKDLSEEDGADKYAPHLPAY